MGDFEKQAINNEEQQLKYYTIKANQEVSEHIQHMLLLNMSISEILQRMSQTVIDIINDLTNTDDLNLRNVIIILFKGDRMVYIGLILILIALSFYLIDITK